MNNLSIWKNLFILPADQHIKIMMRIIWCNLQARVEGHWKICHRNLDRHLGPVYTTPDKYLHGEPQLQEQVFTRSRRSFSSCPHDIRNTRVSWLFSGRNTCLRPNFCAWKAAARASAILSLTITLDFPGYPVYTYTGTCMNLSGQKFLHLWSRRNSSTDRSANLRELLRIRVNRMPNRRDISPDKYLPGRSANGALV